MVKTISEGVREGKPTRQVVIIEDGRSTTQHERWDGEKWRYAPQRVNSSPWPAGKNYLRHKE